MLVGGLDLREFYRQVRGHSVLGPLTARMCGLKPVRPAALLEMIAVEITEQQISLVTAYRIRQRLIERFGQRVGGIGVFPGAVTLAAASSASLRACGLSRGKAGCLRALARRAASGTLDLERLKTLDDDQVLAEQLRERGIGHWSAEYILVRGLARPDAVDYDDLAPGRVVCLYLGAGRSFTPNQVRKALLPSTPYRGLAAFYLLVQHRLRRKAPNHATDPYLTQTARNMELQAASARSLKSRRDLGYAVAMAATIDACPPPLSPAFSNPWKFG